MCAVGAEDWTSVAASETEELGEGATDAALLETDAAVRSAPSRVAIHGFERDADGVELFRVSITVCGAFSYELKRRYSQFEALARAMRGASRRHPLPPKYIVRHTDENLAARASALESWLCAVCADAENAAEAERHLWPFLELDAARALVRTHLLNLPCAPDPDLSAELDARRLRSAERNACLSALERDNKEKASELKRLEHGMSTARALVHALKQRLVEAEAKTTSAAPPAADAPPPPAAPPAAREDERALAERSRNAQAQPIVALAREPSAPKRDPHGGAEGAARDAPPAKPAAKPAKKNKGNAKKGAAADPQRAAAAAR